MHNAIAHHLTKSTQPTFKHRSLLPSQLPRFIYWAWHHIVWNISFGHFGSVVLAVSPPSFLWPWQASLRSWKVLDYLATTKNAGILSTLF